MNLTPIVFTHAVVVTNTSIAQIKKTGNIALIYLCAGPGDENCITVKYGKVSPTAPNGVIVPMTAEHTPMLRGSILSAANTFAEFAITMIREHGSLRVGKKYRVSACGSVEVIINAKAEDYQVQQ